MLAPNFCASRLMLFLIILAFVLTGHDISPTLVFTTMMLLAPLQLLLTLFIPFAITMMSESKVTVARIEVFVDLCSSLDHDLGFSYCGHDDYTSSRRWLSFSRSNHCTNCLVLFAVSFSYCSFFLLPYPFAD